MILLTIRKLTWNARCPYNDSLLLHIVPEEFGRPDVDCRRIRHHLDETLFIPMYQILRTSIAKASVTSPTRRPHEMEHTIGRTNNRGVAHHFLIPHLRLQPDAIHLLPGPSVVAINKPQTICGWLVERGRYIHSLLC